MTDQNALSMGRLTGEMLSSATASQWVTAGSYRRPAPTVCAIDIDTLRQIRILLRCIQQPVVAYDSDLLTMVQSAVGYCGEKAAEIEALLPQYGMLEDGE